MRLVIQRVEAASVEVAQTRISAIGPGLCIFLGVARDDTEDAARRLADKVTRLRIFEDQHGRMNHDLAAVHGEILVVSQFTLYGDCTQGNRPSFSRAATAKKAERLYEYFVSQLRAAGANVSTGQFQAKMNVSISNDGPVTFILED